MNKLKQLLEQVKKIRNATDNAPADVSEKILDQLKKITYLLELSLLEKKMHDSSRDMERLTGTKILEDIDPRVLMEACQNRTEDGHVEFLMYRPTTDGEYASYSDGIEYSPKDELKWTPSEVAAKNARVNNNPVVACWIPEDSISSIPEFYENASSWGDLGANPFTDKFVIVTEPGKYKIYSELRV